MHMVYTVVGIETIKNHRYYCYKIVFGCASFYKIIVLLFNVKTSQQDETFSKLVFFITMDECT